MSSDAFENEINSELMDDATKAFLKKIKRYPLLESNEQKALIREYQNGNINVKEKIINSNLRLVVSIASKYISKVTHLSLLDLVQEGTMGLMRSIETYDEQQGALSTYATYWIKVYISRSIEEKEQSIKKSSDFINKEKKYKRFISEYYRDNLNFPSDDVIKETLGVSSKTLKLLKESVNYDVVSIDKKVNDDDSNSDELIDFISSGEDLQNSVFKNEESFDYLNVIKSVLTSKEYYVLYNRVLSENQRTLQEIAKEFGVSREYIRILEERALKKVRPYSKMSDKLFDEALSRLRTEHTSRYYKLKTKPLTPNDICLFLYLKDKLSDTQQNMLYLKVIDKYQYSDEEIKSILNLNSDEYQKERDYLYNLIKQELKSNSNFVTFKSKIIKQHGVRIYDIKLIDKSVQINYEHLKEKYANLSLDELQELFGEELEKLTLSQQKLIYKYYAEKKSHNIPINIINREITLLLSGYKTTNITNISKLYQTFLNNKDNFSEEQILYLETHFFNVKPKKVFLNIYPKSSLIRHSSFVIDKLQCIHYGMHRMFENNFNKEKYMLIRDKYNSKLEEKRIEILDLYYGINGDKKTIQEMADIYNVSYTRMHDILRYAREYAINLYLNRNRKIDIDKSIYHKYILDPRFIIPEETRKLLIMFMIENKSYDEISSLTGLSNYTISNRITEMIRKIDNYRFKLLHFEEHTKETLNKFYRECGLAFSEIEKQMLESKYLVGLENPDIAKKYGVSKDEVNRLVARFNKSYFSYQIRDVKLTKEEIEEDVNKPIIESVTSEREKQYISYYYGIKNKYNPVGEKLTNAEIYKKFEINKNIFHHVFELGISKIKGRKIGISRPDLLYIEKDELIELLKDSHLPISKKEREIINYLFGLNGYQKKTIDGLSEMYGETQGGIKRRYMRSIVSICKYKNNEIEGKINYDTDVYPNLKYFPNNYRQLIEEYYKNGLTYEKMAKKYYITVDQVINIFDRIKDDLFDVINNPKKQRFDFDFYEKNKNNPNIPFYGDSLLADKIFRLYFGMDDIRKLGALEIKEKLNLTYEVSWINKTILDYMLAICKLKDGITKSRQFTYDEVMEHYLKFEKTIPPIVKASYKRYFDRMDNNKYTYVKRPNINEVIICDILKEKYKYYIDVSSLSREQVINLLKKYYKDIDSSIRDELMYLFNITEKEFMSGKKLNHLYRILNNLDNKILLEKNSSYKKQMNRK